MNKYIKLLALTGGLLGAIAPTAIKVGEQGNDFDKIYDNVEKMQNIIPRLSKINCQLNIDSVQDNNVKFISTDEVGNETELTQDQTLASLGEVLEQTNIEYEQLKQTLATAINDTMRYLEKYNNGEIELTNEQKLSIKEHSNSIKFLAETLEDLSEDMICAIDGCDENDDFEETASKYISTINALESRINTLQDSLNSLQFINSITNPYFRIGHYYEPNRNIYGLRYDTNDDNLNMEDKSGLDENNVQENNEQSSGLNDENLQQSEDDNNQVQEVEQSSSDTSVEEVNNDKVDDGDNKPTTFGLKSNIDTYAPTKRNIDTFFNTALYNNDYMYGNGGYMPYGYGGGYGYGMPYGGAYGNPYGMSGLNSNMVNRAVLDEATQANPQHQNNLNNGSVANIETEVKEDVSKPKKIRARRAKNIDTYTGTTIQSNVNTMGESKISKFFKEKFNNLRSKLRKQKNEIVEQNNTETKQLEQADDVVDIKNENETLTNNLKDENIDNLIVDTNSEDNAISTTIEKNIKNNEKEVKIIEEKQIKAK